MAEYIVHFQKENGREFTRKMTNPDFDALRRQSEPKYLYATLKKGTNRRKRR